MSAVLLAVLRPDDNQAGEFFTWYETEHVTGRMAMPGFLHAHRYVAGDDPNLGLLIYELAGLGALATTRYRALQAATAEATRLRMGGLRTFVRVTGTVIQEHGTTRGPAPALLVAAFPVPDGELPEFDSWYRREQAPMLLEAGACQGVRLVEVADSNAPWKRVAIHRLTGGSALDPPLPRATAGTGPGAAAQAWWEASTRYAVTAVERFRAVSG